MSSMPTTLDNGRYQLGQLVGRGGMAEVHIALDTRLGRTVAVKTCAPTSHMTRSSSPASAVRRIPWPR